jgi:hypothetical protein
VNSFPGATANGLVEEKKIEGIAFVRPVQSTRFNPCSPGLSLLQSQANLPFVTPAVALVANRSICAVGNYTPRGWNDRR